MADKNFDKAIRNALKDHMVPYDPKNWPVLEDEMDELALQEIEQTRARDQKIQSKLKNHVVSYKNTHWKKLKARLDLQDELRRKIYITKLAEVSVLVLLIFSFFHLKPYQRILNSPLFEQNNEQTTPLPSSTIEENKIESVDVFEYKKKQNNTLTPADSENLITTSEVASEFTDSEQRLSDLHIPQYTATDIIENRDRYELIPIRNDRPNISMLYSESGHERNEKVIEIVNSRIPASYKKNNRTVINQKHELLSIPEVPIGYEDTGVFSLRSDRISKMIKPLAIKNEKEHWFGLFGSFDLNVINRPLDIKIFQRPEHYGAFGSTFGFQYGSRKGRHEFETGLAYSVKSYNPNLQEKVKVNTSFYEREFNRQSFEIFQMPFNYKWHSSDSGDWNFFTYIGTELNVVTTTEYHFDNILKSGHPRSETAIESNSKLEQIRDFHKGLLQGGSAFKNLYITATIGFGLEKQFGNHLFYIQPHYKHHMFTQQLGPNNEKLNSLSLQLGTKIKL